MKKYLIIFLIFMGFLPALFGSKLPILNEKKDTLMPQEILVYVNQYRASRGLPPLKMNKSMSHAAFLHSHDMATHRIGFGHVGFNKRIKKLFTTIKDCHGGAENVAYNYKDAKNVVKNWLTSPGHRRNIIGHYNLTGIGIARDSKGKIYFTQIFLNTSNHRFV